MAVEESGSGKLVEQLESLAALRTAGELTDDEYEAAKARVLGSAESTQVAEESRPVVEDVVRPSLLERFRAQSRFVKLLIVLPVLYVVFIALSSLVVLVGDGGSNGSSGSGNSGVVTSSAPASSEYLDRYGGQAAVYSRIAGLTRCSALDTTYRHSTVAQVWPNRDPSVVELTRHMQETP